MDFDLVAWDDMPGGNVEHVAEHGLTSEDVEDVLYDPASRPGVSRSSGRPQLFGHTADGRQIVVVYERDRSGGLTVLTPITAYEVPGPT